jgi:hypothetical protein
MTAAQLLGVFLVHVLGEGELGHKDLAGLGQHALFSCGQTLFLISLVEAAHDVCDLIDVTRLQLLDVRLEATRPVGRVGRWFVLPEDLEDLGHLLGRRNRPKADFVGGVDRHHQGQFTVGELQNEVVAHFAHELALLALLDDGCAVMRIDDLVAD